MSLKPLCMKWLTSDVETKHQLSQRTTSTTLSSSICLVHQRNISAQSRDLSTSRTRRQHTNKGSNVDFREVHILKLTAFRQENHTSLKHKVVSSITISLNNLRKSFTSKLLTKTSKNAWSP